MKKIAAFGVASLLFIVVSGCRQNNQYQDVVKETYIHKYGVPVAKGDWDEQGKDGKIVKLKKDGVTVTQTYSKGVLDGETTYTFSNSSTIHRVETFDQGKLIAVRENYSSGVPKREEVYEEGTIAKKTRWYDDGTPAATEAYQGNSLIDGKYLTPLNVVESQVQNGEGTRIYRSSQGDLMSKDTIHNGDMVERVTYFSNGDPQTVTPFSHGKIHGTRHTYLQGGQPNTAEEWVHGKQEGITVVYLNGEKYAEIPFKNGKKNGVEARFRDGSEIVEELSWKENLKHGQRKLYIDGEVKSEWYHQGEVVSRTTFERMNLPR